jgi:hypothetical protein
MSSGTRRYTGQGSQNILGGNMAQVAARSSENRAVVMHRLCVLGTPLCGYRADVLLG